MKPYCVSILVISVFTLTITLLTFISSVRTFANPESSLSGTDYKKFSNFEYYKQIELEYNTDKKNMKLFENLSEIDWKKRWTLYKELCINEVIHKEKSSFFHELIYALVFTLLIGLHIFLYKKFVVSSNQ